MDRLDVRRNRSADSNLSKPLRESGSQTAGPYVHIGCFPNHLDIKGIYPNDLISNNSEFTGEQITITGHVFDGKSNAGKDIMLEIWHADAAGDFQNGIWQRSLTDLETGQFKFKTIKPGTFKGRDGNFLAPFITFWIVARGINIGLVTRMYFPDEEMNSTDVNLIAIHENRRATLIASSGANPNEYRFDIHLQGDTETVFFDI